MRTILDILERAGGWHPGLYLKIDNLPYMELVIEAVGEPGPMGLSALSVAHYGEQNGALMRDPEMCFELRFHDGPELNPYYYRNNYVGVEQWSRNLVRAHYVCLEMLHRQHERFAKTWDNNLSTSSECSVTHLHPSLLRKTPQPCETTFDGLEGLGSLQWD